MLHALRNYLGLAAAYTNNYDLRYLIGLIAKSSAYQLSSKYPGEWKLEYVPYYARKYARRLDAEEIHDAIVKATGQPIVTTFRDGANQNQTAHGEQRMHSKHNQHAQERAAHSGDCHFQ